MSDTVIKAYDPHLPITGYYDVTVRVADQYATREKAYHVNGPVITSVTPESPLPGEVVTVAYENPAQLQGLGLITSYENGVLVLSHENNVITFLCPNILGNLKLNVGYGSIYDGILSETKVITINNPWKEIQSNISYALPFNSTIYQGYGYVSDGRAIHKFDPATNRWEITQCPMNTTPSYPLLFGYNDELFVSGIAGNNNNGPLFRYNIPTGNWSVCNDTVPVRTGNYYYPFRTLIGSTYYVYDMNLYASHFVMYKYSANEDKWSSYPVPKNQFYQLFTHNNKMYAFTYDGELCAINPDNVNKEFVEQTFPYDYFFTYPRNGAMKGNQLFFSMNDMIWKYDFETKEFSTLGVPAKPNHFEYTIDLIFPFEDRLIIGCNGKLYEYQKLKLF